MPSGMQDVTKFFGRPKDLPYGGKYQVFLDPNTGQLQGRKYRMGRHSDIWDAFDPNSLNFKAEEFSSAFGLPNETPTGDPLFGGKSTFSSVSDALRKHFGSSLGQFLGMGSGGREDLFRQSQEKVYGEVFDPKTGLPNRPPKNQQEALMWQWQADEYGRKMQEGQMANALKSVQFGLGQVASSSPYGMSTMQSPLFRDMSNIYSSFQYTAPDYSAFFRPDVSAESPSNSFGGMPSLPGGGGISPAMMPPGGGEMPQIDNSLVSDPMNKRFAPAGF